MMKLKTIIYNSMKYLGNNLAKYVQGFFHKIQQMARGNKEYTNILRAIQ